MSRLVITAFVSSRVLVTETESHYPGQVTEGRVRAGSICLGDMSSRLLPTFKNLIIFMGKNGKEILGTNFFCMIQYNRRVCGMHPLFTIVWKEIGKLKWFAFCISLDRKSQIWNLFGICSIKWSVFLHTCIRCPKLPSHITTMEQVNKDDLKTRKSELNSLYRIFLLCNNNRCLGSII